MQWPRSRVSGGHRSQRVWQNCYPGRGKKSAKGGPAPGRHQPWTHPQMIHKPLAEPIRLSSASMRRYWLQRFDLKHRSLFVASLSRPHNNKKAAHIIVTWCDLTWLVRWIFSRSRHATRMGLATCWIGPGADHKSIVAKMGSRFDEAGNAGRCDCAGTNATP